MYRHQYNGVLGQADINLAAREVYTRRGCTVNTIVVNPFNRTIECKGMSLTLLTSAFQGGNRVAGE
jgi:hypothetical protein